MTAYVPPSTGTLQDAIRSLLQLASGRSNATGTVTLTPGATTTTVADNNCAAGSVIIINATTTSAAAAFPDIVYSTANKSFTLTHDNSGATDRTFRYAILG